MISKAKVELWLFLAAAAGAILPLAASMAHLLTAFPWANLAGMAWVLAVATAVLNVLFIALSVISRDKKLRRAIYAGMAVIFMVEFFGNLASGGLIAMHNIPPELSEFFFGISHSTLVWIGTLLLAAFLPVLNFIAVLVLSEAAVRLLDRQEQVNPFAVNLAESIRKAANEKDKTSGYADGGNEADVLKSQRIS